MTGPVSEYHFYTVTTKEGLVVKMARCCAEPKPMFEVKPPPPSAPARQQRIVCTSCWAVLVELSWPNLAVLS
jgi:hypothetical protein